MITALKYCLFYVTELEIKGRVETSDDTLIKGFLFKKEKLRGIGKIEKNSIKTGLFHE